VGNSWAQFFDCRKYANVMGVLSGPLPRELYA
jgi:hypothetical protein